MAREWEEYESIDEAIDYELTGGYSSEPLGKWITLLRMGIVPLRPFRVRVGCPRGVSYWTDCGTEYDTDYDVELVELAVWDEERTAYALEGLMARFRRAELRKKEFQLKRQREAWADRSALRIWVHSDYSRGLYSDMGTPDIFHAHLVGKGNVTLTSVSDCTSHLEALDSLWLRSATLFPGMTKKKFMSLH